MTSHMITSAPSNPPSRAYSAWVIRVSAVGSSVIASRNLWSHSGLLKPAPSPCTWWDSPPVDTTATSMSSG